MNATNNSKLVYVFGISALSPHKSIKINIIHCLNKESGVSWEKQAHTQEVSLRECVENGQIEVEYVQGDKQKVDILTKALGRIRFKEMRDYIGVKENFKLKGENVG